MSLENQYETPVATGVNTLPPKKSKGGLKWILGGCGFLGLLTVLCFGGLIWFSLSKAGKMSQEARSFIENSTVAQEYLGNPITITAEAPPAQGPQGALVLGFDVSGPKASGKATVNAELDPETFDFVLGESSLDVNGETIDLNAEDEFKLDVEGMDDF